MSGSIASISSPAAASAAFQRRVEAVCHEPMPVHRLRTGRDSVDPTTARVTFAERLETDNAAYRRAASEARAMRMATGVTHEGAHEPTATAASLRVPLGVALGDIPEARSMAQAQATPAKPSPRVQPVPIGSIIDLIA